MRVGFAGTPAFAASALAAIVAAGHDVPVVLTRPDRPQGRGLRVEAHGVDDVAVVSVNDHHVMRAWARFTGPREVEAGDTRVQARRFVIATGSRAATG